MPGGFVLVDKAPGFSSSMAVQAVRQLLEQPAAPGARKRRKPSLKVGHAGTLDPFASGLLVIGVGRGFTRLLSQLLNMDKSYDATLLLGVGTDTLDLEGKLAACQVPPPPRPSLAELEEALASVRGTYQQRVPDYSAKSVDGKKFYKLARAGEEVPERYKEVTVAHASLIAGAGGAVELVATEVSGPVADADDDASPDDGRDRLADHLFPAVSFRVTCSSGTYVRQIGADIAKALGTVGHLVALRRTHVGSIDVANAISVDGLRERAASHDSDDGGPSSRLAWCEPLLRAGCNAVAATGVYPEP